MRTLFLLLLTTLLPALAHGQVQVFACEPEWGALTNALAGDRAEVFVATTANQDPHHIEARPSLIAKMRRADLVVCTGAELEVGWLPLLIRRSGNPNVQTDQPGYFEAAMSVPRLNIPETLDRSHGDVHSAGNPHVHLDPHRLLSIARALAERLQQVDPPHQAHYQQRLDDFAQHWQRRIQHWEQQAQALSGLKVVVHHQDWLYLNHWLGLNQVATIEPRPGIPPSAADQKRLLRTLTDQPPDAILIAGYQNPQAARWLAERLQVPLVTLPYTVGGDSHSNGLSELFQRTLHLLLQTRKVAP
ncbi:MAG: zinc ABC transporter substrate-binding protein [Pseudomonadota bacterium]|nr:zinc ABC transporter substrate-binding protein [Pseudomonadota bacterium]